MKYFDRKAGKEIEALRAFLKDKTFIGYLLGKKNSGKGTYSKLFMEATGVQDINHVSVGDIVRDVHLALENPKDKEAFLAFMQENYRGFHSLEEIVESIEGRTQSALISTELIVALLKYEISRRPRQSAFIDGFPRGLDQISYAIYLKELLGYRNDPDFFVFLSLPNTIIDERIKYRVICPICKTPRNLKLLATKEAGWDENKKEFYLMCDNPSCNNKRMVPKQGDELGIEPIRARLNTDQEIFEKLLNLQGVPKVLLRNSIPVTVAKDMVDDYEITPAYSYERGADGKVKVIESPWVINDDSGTPSYSLLPAAVVLGMLKQTAQVLGLV